MNAATRLMWVNRIITNTAAAMNNKRRSERRLESPAPRRCARRFATSGRRCRQIADVVPVASDRPGQETGGPQRSAMPPDEGQRHGRHQCDPAGHAGGVRAGRNRDPDRGPARRSGGMIRFGRGCSSGDWWSIGSLQSPHAERGVRSIRYYRRQVQGAPVCRQSAQDGRELRLPCGRREDRQAFLR